MSIFDLHRCKELIIFHQPREERVWDPHQSLSGCAEPAMQSHYNLITADMSSQLVQYVTVKPCVHLCMLTISCDVTLTDVTITR